MTHILAEFPGQGTKPLQLQGKGVLSPSPTRAVELRVWCLQRDELTALTLFRRAESGVWVEFGCPTSQVHKASGSLSRRVSVQGLQLCHPALGIFPGPKTWG